MKHSFFATTMLGSLCFAPEAKAQTPSDQQFMTVDMEVETTHGLKTFQTAPFRPSASLHIKNMYSGPLLDDRQVLTIGNETLLPHSFEISMSKQNRRAGGDRANGPREAFIFGIGMQRGDVSSTEFFLNGTQRQETTTGFNSYAYGMLTPLDLFLKGMKGKLVGSIRLHAGVAFGYGTFEKSGSLISNARIAAGYKIGGKDSPWILGLSTTATGLFSHILHKDGMGEKTKETKLSGYGTGALLLQIPLGGK